MFHILLSVNFANILYKTYFRFRCVHTKINRRVLKQQANVLQTVGSSNKIIKMYLILGSPGIPGMTEKLELLERITSFRAPYFSI